MSPANDLGIRQVDEITITVLVDNAIEWFHPWPPEFKFEIPVQMHNNPPIDPVTGTPIIDLENFCCGAHGLALLVTTKVGEEENTILFDAGPESKSIERNIRALKPDLSGVERIVLSHWHSDHSGGILKALELLNEGRAATGNQSTIIVDVHPDRPEARGIWPPGGQAPTGRLPADPTFDELKRAGAEVETHAEPHLVGNGTMFVSGQIARRTKFETGIVGGCQWVDGRWVKGIGNPGSLIMDERYLAVDVKDKGLVVFSSCSHAGIVNVCMSALQAFKSGKRPLYAVVGGYHLGGVGMEERIPATVEYFSNTLAQRPRFMVPMHCTGFNAKVALKNAMGDIIVPAGSGSRIFIPPIEERTTRFNK